MMVLLKTGGGLQVNVLTRISEKTVLLKVFFFLILIKYVSVIIWLLCITFDHIIILEPF